MWHCYYCRTPLPVSVQKRNRLCPSCGSDIHCCKNCAQYDENASAKCKEPHSPWLRDRSTQNTCPYFEFKSANQATEDRAQVEAERAKEAFKALFRNA